MQKSRRRRPVFASDHVAGFRPDPPIASAEHSDNEVESRPAPSTVAGMSTSRALALLNPPPEDAQKGSEDLPWLRLTEWEMTKLRKKMKKNAVWQPSEIMIHRELLSRGRGWEGYRAAKEQAEETGEELLDCDDILNNYMPGKLTLKTDPAADSAGMEEIKTSNRGMKLNEAKKLKRKHLAREQAAAAAEAELAAKRLGDIGSAFKSLFPSSGDVNQASSNTQSSPLTATKDKEKSKSQKKRRAEESPTTETCQNPDSSLPTETTKPANKRRRLNRPGSADAPADISTELSMNATTHAAPSTSLQSITAPSGTSKPTPSLTGSKPPPAPAAAAASAAPNPVAPISTDCQVNTRYKFSRICTDARDK
jgi:hypothetical protein